MPSAVNKPLISARNERAFAAQLDAIVQSSHDAVIETDLNGTTTGWNRDAQRQNDYRSDKIADGDGYLLPNADARVADPRISGLRIVDVSADAELNQMNRLTAAGVYANVAKPLDVARMLELLHTLMPRSTKSPA